MRITVGLPSRGRPLEMVASALSLLRLASGGHDVRITLAIDKDDAPTEAAAADLEDRFNITAWVSDRPYGLGELHNKVAALAGDDAAFLLWSDRVQCISPNWDHELAVGCMQYPNRVLWLDSIHLNGAGQFILPPAWRAAQGDPCPGLFPFWFEDTHVEELDALVHGFPRVALTSKCAGPRNAKTNRCREVAFWVDVYEALRPKRLEQAAEIVAKLGVPARDMSAENAYFAERMAAMRARAEQLEATFGEASEPDASYLAAKERARAAVGL